MRGEEEEEDDDVGSLDSDLNAWLDDCKVDEETKQKVRNNMSSMFVC